VELILIVESIPHEFAFRSAVTIKLYRILCVIEALKQLIARILAQILAEVLDVTLTPPFFIGVLGACGHVFHYGCDLLLSFGFDLFLFLDERLESCVLVWEGHFNAGPVSHCWIQRVEGALLLHDRFHHLSDALPIGVV
jgi:uncharacterized membrane protein